MGNTQALLPHLRPCQTIWECAAGTGQMVRVLEGFAESVIATDIVGGCCFFETEKTADAIITNPPYVLATEFIERALSLMSPRGLVAMLLRTDFDHARTRHHLFGGCASFAKKLVLMKRIKWFEDSEGSPSFNHAWFIWDHQHQGWPTIAYGP